MNEQSDNERVLTRNAIKRFILRVDFIPNSLLDVSKIAESMSKHFDRIEKRQINNFTVSFTKGNSEMSENKSFDYVLMSEKTTISMTISEVQNAFWLESSQYLNRLVYQNIVAELITVVSSFPPNIEAKRIGMRYVNEFKCEKSKDISRIFGKRLSAVTKNMLKPSSQSRVIAIEEYNNDDLKLRVQYGVMNKFYPARITVNDLILDIDSYAEVSSKPQDWQATIANLNHSAHKFFLLEMNENYIAEVLK